MVPRPEGRVGVRRGPVALWLLVLLAAGLFLGHGSRTIAAPFGDSHDGRNGGVWAAGSRSLRESGPIASRLGTHSAENGVYANHPPLLYVETALSEVIGRSSPAATRAPAWIGSLVFIVLLAALLREVGLQPKAAGMAVVLVACTPMFLVYGTMLDTPVSSLPFGVGLLLLWERARRGRAVPPLTTGAVAALAVLAGWQSLLLALVIGGWAVVRARRRTGGDKAEQAFAAGALVGLALLVAWLLWAFGGTIRPLLDQFFVRTGASKDAVGWGRLFAVERRDLAATFAVLGVLGLGGLLVALRDPRLRSLAGLALAVTVPYPVVFRSGAVNHNYWNYWLLLPLAVGLAAGADALLARWQAAGRRQGLVVVGAAVVGTSLAAAAWVAPGPAEAMKLRGFAPGRSAVAGASLLGPAQREAWYAGAVGDPPAWLALATGRKAVLVLPPQYEAFVARNPTDLVFVGDVRCVDGRDEISTGFRPATTLLDPPPGIAPCP